MRLDFYCCSFWLTIGFVFGLRLSTRQFWLFPSFVCKALQGIIDSFDFCLVADFLLTDENLLLVFWLLTGKKAIGCFLSTGLVCCYSWCLHFWQDCGHLFGRCWVSDQNWLHTIFNTNIYSTFVCVKIFTNVTLWTRLSPTWQSLWQGTRIVH